MLKRAHDGTFHKMSPKHLQRYVSEFAGKPTSATQERLRRCGTRWPGLIGRNLLSAT